MLFTILDGHSAKQFLDFDGMQKRALDHPLWDGLFVGNNNKTFKKSQ